jgi:hypothetical protein
MMRTLNPEFDVVVAGCHPVEGEPFSRLVWHPTSSSVLALASGNDAMVVFTDAMPRPKPTDTEMMSIQSAAVWCTGGYE